MTDRRDWPIVVGGCHRSGTSLMRRVLDSHSRIHCGPELTFFRDFYGEYFDDALNHLRFATTARTILPEEDLLPVLGRGFIEVHERGARRAGKPRWADKSPENVIHTADWNRLLGDRWLFVHVVRNPVDTLGSMKESGFPLTLPAGLDERIEWYRRCAEAGMRFRDQHPERYRLVLYEDLVAEPAAYLTELMEWLGETFEPVQTTPNATAHQRGLEDPKLLETRTIHDASIGRGAEILSGRELRAIAARTTDLWERIDPERRHGRADRTMDGPRRGRFLRPAFLRPALRRTTGPR